MTKVLLKFKGHRSQQDINRNGIYLLDGRNVKHFLNNSSTFSGSSCEYYVNSISYSIMNTAQKAHLYANVSDFTIAGKTKIMSQVMSGLP